MRTNGEIGRDAQVVVTLRRIADALDAIAGTLAAIHSEYLMPQDAMGVVMVKPPTNCHPPRGED